MDLNRGLTVQDLEQLIGDRDYRNFLNTRNELYRERNMKANPPSRSEAIALMSKNPNLIRRPILVSGNEVLTGFDEPTWRSLVTKMTR